MIRVVRRSKLPLAALALVAISCSSIGPGSISRDRFDYGTAISDSWKEQLLLNLVKVRYVEAPVFVDVASVINQYALEGEVSGGLGWGTSILGEETQTLGAAGRWSDRPTITYSPISGQKFAQSLLTPLRPEALFAMVQAGWPPDFLFRLTVRSANGVAGASARPSNRREADPRFIELLEAWGRLRSANALGLRRVDEEGETEIVVYAMPGGRTEQVARDLEFVCETLGLDPSATEYRLSYGLLPEDRNEIAVLTSSILEIMVDLSSRVDVPEEHVANGRTTESFTEEGLSPLIQVHCSTSEPDDSYVAVKNRGYWFYIDDRDLLSKRTFAVLQVLLSLTESGTGARGPVVSIGT